MRIARRALLPPPDSRRALERAEGLEAEASADARRRTNERKHSGQPGPARGPKASGAARSGTPLAQTGDSLLPLAATLGVATILGAAGLAVARRRMNRW